MKNEITWQVSWKRNITQKLMRTAAFGAGTAAIVPALTAGRVLAASEPRAQHRSRHSNLMKRRLASLQRRMASWRDFCALFDAGLLVAN